MKRLLTVLLFLPVFALAQDAPETAMPDSVLLVYSSGTPLEGFGVTTVSNEALDAITCPTPTENNTGIAARQIYEGLTEKGVAVRIARVEEFERKEWRQLLAYRTIIMGSPTRHSNMSWEFKRFVDEVFHQIYMQVPDRAGGIQFALFSTAAHGGGPEETMNAMETFIRHCNGVVVQRLNLNSGQTRREFDEAIRRFCDIMAILAK